MKPTARTTLGLIALAVLAASPEANAAERPPEPAASTAYSMSGQVSAVYRIDAGAARNVLVIRSDFGGPLPFDATAPAIAQAQLKKAGSEAVRIALAAGAVEGRADSVAIVYRLGPSAEAGAGSFAPVAMFHCETRFAVDGQGRAHVDQAVRVTPIAAPTPDEAPSRRFEDPQRDSSPDFLPQPLPER